MSHVAELSENQEDKLALTCTMIQREVHLSENQEDKLVSLRTLHEGLYTTICTG